MSSCHPNRATHYIAMTCICTEFWQRAHIRLLSLIVILLLVKSSMKNAHEEFLSDSEMRQIENVMTARYSLNTEVCRNHSAVRILRKPNGRYLKRLRFGIILYNGLFPTTENTQKVQSLLYNCVVQNLAEMYPGHISLDTIRSTE